MRARRAAWCGVAGGVGWAIAQNAAVERKVRQAAEDLEEVNELLEQARAGL